LDIYQKIVLFWRAKDQVEELFSRIRWLRLPSLKLYD
jgi:hypothetical protein